MVDSLVVHLEDPTGGPGELLLFVVLRRGLDARRRAARRGSRRELRTALSPRHVPDEIYQVGAVPRTLSGKKLEVPVKRILTGTPVEQAAARAPWPTPSRCARSSALARRARRR